MEFTPFQKSDRFYLHDNQGNYWIHDTTSCDASAAKKIKSDEPGQPWNVAYGLFKNYHVFVQNDFQSCVRGEIGYAMTANNEYILVEKNNLKPGSITNKGLFCWKDTCMEKAVHVTFVSSSMLK